MVHLYELNRKKEISKLSKKEINKCLIIHIFITSKRINFLSIIYSISFFIVFSSSFCQKERISFSKENIMYMKMNVTKNTYYFIINTLNNVNPIEINGTMINNSFIYLLDIGEHEIKIRYNEPLTDCSRLLMSSPYSFVDLSNFDTSQCTSFASMFKNCKRLTSIKLGNNFNTSKAKDMSSIFENVGTNKFINIDLSKFDTSKVTNMKNMFKGSYFKFLNLSSFNTSNVINMEGMFADSQILSLNLSNFNTSKVTDMSYMFSNCSHLISLDISNFDFNFVSSTKNIFYKINPKLKFCSDNITSSLIIKELIEANIMMKCNDPCFTNKINKFIISNSTCIENCYNFKYKYEFNNICYSNFSLEIEEYLNSLYFHNDLLDFKETLYNKEMIECSINNYFIGYYCDNKTKKLYKCPKKCKTCEKGSVVMNLCLECNNDYFYYEIENSNKKENNYANYIDCIKMTSDQERYRYLSSNNGCSPGEYFYYDNSKILHCDDKCPYGYYMVPNKQKCTVNCLFEYPYIHKYNNTCYDVNGTITLLPGIREKISLKLGETMNSSESYFIFDLEGTEDCIEFNFKIKSDKLTFYEVRYNYTDNILNLSSLILYDIEFLVIEFNMNKTEKENNYETNYFTITKNASNFILPDKGYLIVFYSTTDGRAEITSLKEEEKEKEGYIIERVKDNEKEREKEENIIEKEREDENEIENVNLIEKNVEEEHRIEKEEEDMIEKKFVEEEKKDGIEKEKEYMIENKILGEEKNMTEIEFVEEEKNITLIEDVLEKEKIKEGENWMEKEEEKEEEKKEEKEEEKEENTISYILGSIAGVIVIIICIIIYYKRKNKKIKEVLKDKKKIISNSDIIYKINVNNNTPLSEIRKISPDNGVQAESLRDKNEIIREENLLNINKEYNKSIEEKIEDLTNEGYKIIIMDDKINSIILSITSSDQIIRCAVICKTDRIFNVIINKIYEDFPEFKKYEPVFLSGGKRIPSYQSLKESGILDDAAIILNIMNE